MRYIFGCVFGLFALLPLARLLSGLRSGVVELKLYLPPAKRSERPALYWVFICANLLVFAFLVFVALFMLWRKE